jgi:hypothetical protein
LTAKGGYAVHDQEGVGRAYLPWKQTATGCYEATQTELTRALGKSLGMIGKKIAELG